MTLKSILAFAHALLESTVGPGDTVIDCTMGNGHDTLFLANLVGEQGQVFAFDIQQDALRQTQKLLDAHQAADQVNLVHASHAELTAHIPAELYQKVRAAVFNLGYLPGGNKDICTAPDTTIYALESLLSILAPGGLIVVVVYPGHDTGQLEASAVLNYCSNLPRELMHVVSYRILNNPNRPPFVIALEKKDT